MGLFDFHLCLFVVVIWIPLGADFIAAGILQPELSPFGECEIFGCEVFVHDVDEVIQGGVFPFE